jgi:hypothetical protein
VKAQAAYPAAGIARALDDVSQRHILRGFAQLLSPIQQPRPGAGRSMIRLASTSADSPPFSNSWGHETMTDVITDRFGRNVGRKG